MAVSAEDLMKWQEDLSNTSHQREVADLQAAGLNPVLSAGSLSGASTPSGTTSGSSSSGSGSYSGSGNSSEKESRPGADTPLGQAIYGLNPQGNTFGMPNWLIQYGFEQVYNITNGDVSVDGFAKAMFGDNVSGANFYNQVLGNIGIESDSGNKVNDTNNSARYVDTSAKQNVPGIGYGTYNVGNTTWKNDASLHSGRSFSRRDTSDVDAIAGVFNNEYIDRGETLLYKLAKLVKKVSPWLH